MVQITARTSQSIPPRIAGIVSGIRAAEAPWNGWLLRRGSSRARMPVLDA
jgi:hypothetical protein